VRFAVPDDLAAAAFERLGVGPPRDLAGLTALYLAWLDAVPFDNLTKGHALRLGRPNLEGDPVVLLSRWLDHGFGGTCWSLVAAFAALCEAGGLPTLASVERARWRRPPDVDLHGSPVVQVGERRYLCDLVHPAGRPLPLRPGEHGSHGPYSAGLSLAADGGVEHWFRHPDMTHPDLRYRMLSTEAGPEDVAALVRVAEVLSGVGVERPRWRRFPDGRTVRVSAPEHDHGWVVHTWGVGGEDDRVEAAPDAEAAFALAGAIDPAATAALVAEAWPDH
jgi:hypothetical protein